MKKIILFFTIICLFNGNVFAAGSSGGDTKSNYDQAVKLIKAAKKNEEKGKKRKLSHNMKKHLNY